MSCKYADLADRSGGRWTIHQHKERLGVDPLRRTPFTIDDLLNNFEKLGGNELPEDLPLEEVEQNVYSTMYHHRKWDPTYYLMVQKPKHIALQRIRTTRKMVRKHFDSYVIDSTLQPHLISPRKLPSLGLSETIELSDEQLYVLKNQETDFGHFLSAHNLLCPPDINVPLMISEWHLPKNEKRFYFVNDVLNFYQQAITHPMFYIAAPLDDAFDFFRQLHL